MNEKQELPDWSSWSSTYGLLTAERVLERFDIHLSHEELIKASKDPNSVYFQLLRVPLKNIFNGIILQQAHDYQMYAQKLFVDYLLSGEDAKDKDAPGAMTREDIERERVKLMEAGEGFNQLEEAHQILIADSQASLIALSKDINRLSQDPQQIESVLSAQFQQVADINASLRSYRKQFYDLILRVKELLALMADYRQDLVKDAVNRGALAFDALIGEK